MKTNNRSRKSPLIGKRRWAIYAAAGAATALGGSHSLEAEIHYSGHINVPFPPDGETRYTFQLNQPDVSLEFIKREGDYAGFRINSIANRSINKAFRGYGSYPAFVSKLNFGDNISAGAFVRTSTTYWGILAYNGGIGQWTERGVGFIGFRFGGEAGIQYGWARVKMAGQDRKNAFKVTEYAYADPGEPIFAGQKSSDEQAPDQGSTDEDAPDEGSLGGLALGAAGLLAWRKSRSRTTR